MSLKVQAAAALTALGTILASAANAQDAAPKCAVESVDDSITNVEILLGAEVEKWNDAAIKGFSEETFERLKSQHVELTRSLTNRITPVLEGINDRIAKGYEPRWVKILNDKDLHPIFVPALTNLQEEGKNADIPGAQIAINDEINKYVKKVGEKIKALEASRVTTCLVYKDSAPTGPALQQP